MKNGSLSPQREVAPADPLATAIANAVRPLIDEAIERVLVDLEDRPHRDPTPLMTTKQTCRYLAISDRTLHVLRKAGLPHRMVGDSPRYCREELDKFTAEEALKAVAK